MSIPAGTEFGPYRILALIGSGGMGEVYRAHDTRLDRTVAIKILAAHVAADPERLRRFEQEARTLAALNHQNILAVYDVGAQQGTPYLVSELLEGESLRDKLAAGPIPVRRATEYALDIARGLAAGHGKGIVHRDLKPENIFLTSDGRVKILDFGLAKLVQHNTASDDNATLLTQSAGTVPGVVLGTVGYMSPEQVRGEAAGPASDIFSFGAVLFEMLSGKRAFKRDTAAETMTAVLREETPELTQSGFVGPPGLQRILDHCLEKDPRRRFQSAGDLAFAIEALSGSSIAVSQISGVGVIAPIHQTRPWLPWTIGGLAALALGCAGFFFGAHANKTKLPEFNRLTFQDEQLTDAKFTKAGDAVVFSAAVNGSPFQLYSMRTADRHPTLIQSPPAVLYAISGNNELAIGTDFHFLTFMSVGTLSTLPISGGTPRPIQTNVIAAAYTPDSSAMAVARLEGGKCILEYPLGKPIYSTSGYVDHLAFSPDGKWIALDEHPLQSDNRGWISAVSTSGEHKRLTEEYSSLWGAVWAPHGQIVFSSGSNISAVDLNGKVRHLFNSPILMGTVDMSSSGELLALNGDVRFEITGVDASGKVFPHLEEFDASVLRDISMDGKAVTYFDVSVPTGGLYKVVYRRMDGSAPVELGPGSAPAFAPDGSRIAAIVVTSPPQVALYPVGPGSGQSIKLDKLVSAGHVYWMPDGSHVLVVGSQTAHAQSTWLLDLSSGDLKQIAPEGFRAQAVAPDGKRIAGRTSTGENVLFDVATGKLDPVKGVNPGESITNWTADGRGLLVSHPGPTASAYRVEIDSGKRTLLKTVTAPDTIGQDGITILMAQDEKSYAYSRFKLRYTLFAVGGLF